jgi:4'-phosphopantetheinyl transferase
VTIGPHEIHVWYVDLTLPAGDVSLSSHEHERASAFRADRDRVRFVAAHVAVRRVLGTYLDTAPDVLRFGALAFGKPFIEHPATPLRFSLSHSEDLAAVAIAADADVGVDLECVDRQVGDIEALARVCFSADEQRELARSVPAERHVRFLRGWTRKEAYLKAIGQGLQVPPETVPISFDDPPFAVTPGWHVIPLAPGPRAIAALAAPATRAWTVREAWWSPGAPGPAR